MEKEVERIEGMSVQKGAPSDVLMDRKQQIQIKMNMLVLQVQTGNHNREK